MSVILDGIGIKIKNWTWSMLSALFHNTSIIIKWYPWGKSTIRNIQKMYIALFTNEEIRYYILFVSVFPNINLTLMNKYMSIYLFKQKIRCFISTTWREIFRDSQQFSVSSEQRWSIIRVMISVKLTLAGRFHRFTHL